MNATEKRAIEKAWRQARPTDITVEAVSSIGGKEGLREAIRSVEATAAKHQRSGREVLLISIRR